jgi:alkylated DNA repair protein (DNA oxidative demethylase)
MTVPITDLFDGIERADEPIGPGAILLHGFATSVADELLSGLHSVVRAAPFRQMVTPGGWRMSVAMASCGSLGWVTDRTGYRYDPIDPQTGHPWPPMPATFGDLARRAAEAAGFGGFDPEACLINRYEPGARLSLHKDRTERDYDAPIVSVSLGVPATFLWGGMTRAERPRRLRLTHGDVVVWGGSARLTFHGVVPLPLAEHRATGSLRFDLTFRKAG